MTDRGLALTAEQLAQGALDSGLEDVAGYVTTNGCVVVVAKGHHGPALVEWMLGQQKK